MAIQRFEQYRLEQNMIEDFLNNPLITESLSDNELIDKIKNDLKINLSFVGTFGFSIKGLYPVVEGLMKNSSVEITSETIIMMILASLSVIYLEEAKGKNKYKVSVLEQEQLTKETKSLLTELKLRGVGNGLVKKLVKVLDSITNLFKLIGKHTGVVVENTIDMFAYTALLIPILNGVSYIVGAYDMNLDTLSNNLIGLGIGIVTIIAKHGIKTILKKLGVSKDIKKEIIDEIESDQPNSDVVQPIDDGRPVIPNI
jgi:hypothetical protein